MSWFSSFMHPGEAYKRAGEQEQAGYDQAQGMYQPYMQQGQQAGSSLQDMMAKMMNPGALQSEWSQGYETSPYAKQMQSEAQTGGMDAASAMGLGGSNAALSNIQKGSSDIMQKDRQNYMNDMMQKYMGAMGIGQGMYNTGANMTNQAGQNAMNHGQNQAGYAYGQNQAGGNMFGNLLSGVGGLAAGSIPWKKLGNKLGNMSMPGFSGMSSNMYGGS